MVLDPLDVHDRNGVATLIPLLSAAGVGPSAAAQAATSDGVYPRVAAIDLVGVLKTVFGLGRAGLRAALGATSRYSDTVIAEAVDAVSPDPGEAILFIGSPHAMQRIGVWKPTGQQLVPLDPWVMMPGNLAADVVHKTLYWGSAFVQATIGRMNFDGSEPKTMVEGLGIVTGLAVDPQAGYLYWCHCPGDNWLGAIMRSDLDGQGVTVVVDKVWNGGGIGLDPLERRMFWRALTDPNIGSWNIYSAAYDGSDIRVLSTDAYNVGALHLDPTRTRLYFVGNNGLSSIPVTGGDITVIHQPTPASGYGNMDYFPESDRIVWTDNQNGIVYTVNSDGSDPQLIAQGLDQPASVVAVPASLVPDSQPLPPPGPPLVRALATMGQLPDASGIARLDVDVANATRAFLGVRRQRVFEPEGFYGDGGRIEPTHPSAPSDQIEAYDVEWPGAEPIILDAAGTFSGVVITPSTPCTLTALIHAEGLPTPVTADVRLDVSRPAGERCFVAIGRSIHVADVNGVQRQARLFGQELFYQQLRDLIIADNVQSAHWGDSLDSFGDISTENWQPDRRFGYAGQFAWGDVRVVLFGGQPLVVSPSSLIGHDEVTGVSPRWVFSPDRRLHDIGPGVFRYQPTFGFVTLGAGRTLKSRPETQFVFQTIAENVDAFDLSADHIYFVSENALRRMAPGGAPETLCTLAGRSTNISVSAGGTVYWAENDSPFGPLLCRCQPGGDREVVTLLPGPVHWGGVALHQSDKAAPPGSGAGPENAVLELVDNSGLIATE